jgi:V/A-type H+-transporting ATPase subunit I
MAVSRMQKVLLLVHKDEKKSLLEALQDRAILHIRNLRESSVKDEFPEYFEAMPEDREVEDKVSKIGRAINYLKPFGEKGSLLDSFVSNKLPISNSTYQQITSKPSYIKIAKETELLEKKKNEFEREFGFLSSKRETILPWTPLDLPVEQIESPKKVIAMSGVIQNPPKDFKKKIEELSCDIEIVNEYHGSLYIIVTFLPEDGKTVRQFLSEAGFERVNFEGMRGKPKEILYNLEKRLEKIRKEIGELLEKSRSLAKDLNKLFTLYDYHSNILRRERATSLALCTKETIFIEGWIRARDFKQLKNLISNFETASVEVIEPDKNESPPVDLENRKGFKSFETITNLYGTPNHRELDPSSFIAPFFIVFFGFCLTDAAYGIIFAILCLILMRKIKGDKRLLQVLLVSGITTIFIGAITGGWFGDLPERLGGRFPLFLQFRDKFMLFNPMKQPLIFFYLALALGFIQVNVGFFLGFINSLREGNKVEAISNKLIWIFFWTGAGFTAFSFINPRFSGFKIPSGMVVLVAAIIVLLFSGGKSSNWIKKILKGVYNLYQGIMGTISDIISYSRLMALGLVTSGIAIAVNILVGLVGKVPVISIILVPIVFIVGHLFSIGINALGAYVHTLRLQYAEFFTKFFEGGGESFKPLRKEAKYIIIKQAAPNRI